MCIRDRILEDVTITGSSVNAMVRSDGCLTMKGCTVRNGGDYAGDSEGADGSYGLLCSYYGYAGEGTMRTSITSSLIEGGYEMCIRDRSWNRMA